MERGRKSIHLFDLDDTLIQTEARVWVKNAAGEDLTALSPADFTVYRPASDESLDFREFSDLGILSRGIVVKYTKSIIDTILKYGTHSEFGILTARADKKLHAPFLIRLFKSLFGIRLANAHIFAVSDSRFAEYKDRLRQMADDFSGNNVFHGNPESEPSLAPRDDLPKVSFAKLSVSQRKALVIAEDVVGMGFNDISFYDDSRENLESFKVMRKAFPHVTYKPHFIDPTWRVRLREFWESGSESKSLIKGQSSARIILENHGVGPLEWESARVALEMGGALPLAGYPLWLVNQDGKYFLRRKDG